MKITSKTEPIPGDDVEYLYALQEGNILSANSSSGLIKVWNNELKFLSSFTAHDYAICHITATENHLFTTSSDLAIKQWEIGECATEFKLLRVLQGHEEPVRRLWVSDGRLYSGDDLGMVQIWSVETGQLLNTLTMVEEIWDLAVKDGTLYTIRDRDLVMSTLEERKSRSLFEGCSIRNVIPGRSPIHLCPDKICLVTKDGLSISVHEANQTRNPLLGTLKGHSAIIAALSSDGNETLFSGGWDKSLRSWDLTTCQPKDQIMDIGGYINVLAYHPNTNRLYVGGENAVIQAITEF